MIVFTPPHAPNGHLTNTIFLAGSIEMGKAVNWQQRVIKELDTFAGCIYNPRRADWDSTWSADSPQLKAQIEWELDQLSEAGTIFFYFQGDTLSPISLLELGLACAWFDAGAAMNVIVVAETTFWRRTNIVVTCLRHGVPVYHTLEDGLVALKEAVSDF